MYLVSYFTEKYYRTLRFKHQNAIFELVINLIQAITSIYFIVMMKTKWEVDHTEGVPEDQLVAVYWHNIAAAYIKFTYF